jgi:hypothetical protein
MENNCSFVKCHLIIALMVLFKKVFSLFGIEVIRSSTLDRLTAEEKLRNHWKARAFADAGFIMALEGFKMTSAPVSFQSQLGQD